MSSSPEANLNRRKCAKLRTPRKTNQERKDSNFFDAKKTTFQSVVFLIISWLGRMSQVRTFDPDLEVNVEEIRALLDEDNEAGVKL